MKFKRFIVTGGAGFIGSHIVDRLLSEGAERVVIVDNFWLGKDENIPKSPYVIVYKEDARYLTTMETIVDNERPDVIFDLAVHPLEYSFRNPEGAFMSSVEIAHNMAVMLRRRMYQKLVHFSSSEAYGNAVSVPMSETHPLIPTTPYGAGKAAADLLLLSYYNLFDINMVIVRSFNAYGPRQNTGAYPAIIPVTIRRIINGEKPILEGSGSQTRDLTYVTDIAKAAVDLMECPITVGRVINIGSGKEYTVNDILGEICSQMKYDGQYEKVARRTADVSRHLADISLAQKLIGYNPMVNLHDGIGETIKYYKEFFFKDGKQ